MNKNPDKLERLRESRRGDKKYGLKNEYKNGACSCYYVGQTNNIQRRRKEHIGNVVNGKTNHFTGRFDYVKLIWTYKVDTRSEAMQLERAMKELSFEEKRDLGLKKIQLSDVIEIEED